MDDNERLKRFYQRRLFHFITWGALRLNQSRNKTKKRFVCGQFNGEIGYFNEMPVCQLNESDRKRIEEVVQYKKNDNVHMVATMDNGDQLSINPIVLNKWRQERGIRKECDEKVCRFVQSE
jgi:hypothetical protein